MSRENPPTAIEFISRVPYFKDLEDRVLQTIAHSTICREYDAGQLVILEGEPAKGLYIIQDGWLKVSKIAFSGREQTLQFLGPGDPFNIISVLAGEPNPATVTALEPSMVWVVHRDAILRVLNANPSLSTRVIQDLAGRILHLISLVEDLSLRTVEARLARLLLDQSSKERVQRRKWATQEEMAARLGTVSDVVSRVLRKLAEEGLIRVERNQIHILDRPGLEDKATGEG